MYLSSKSKKLSPLLKYPGGKDKELVYILPRLPEGAQSYYEPFVGGGAVYFAVNADNYFINDRSDELMALYAFVKDEDAGFLSSLSQIDRAWKALEALVASRLAELRAVYAGYKSGPADKQRLFDEISSFASRNAKEFNALLSPGLDTGSKNFAGELVRSLENKIVRMAELEAKKGELPEEDLLLNIECAFKSAFYMHFRYLYNNAGTLGIDAPLKAAVFYFLREYCYSSMFRYNKNGGFNVPYGGISYNRKYMTKKLEYFSNGELLEQLGRTHISCDDFEEFLRTNRPQAADFMFLDPPYDSEFSTYAKNAFGKRDQERLAEYLKTACECYFMLIIKNTEFIRGLYTNGETAKNGRRIRISKFDKKYLVSFQNRNNKDAEHLMITNY